MRHAQCTWRSATSRTEQVAKFLEVTDHRVGQCARHRSVAGKPASDDTRDPSDALRGSQPVTDKELPSSLVVGTRVIPLPSLKFRPDLDQI